jgi:Zn-dependent M28 family amino/carboxypeptidase
MRKFFLFVVMIVSMLDFSCSPKEEVKEQPEVSTPSPAKGTTPVPRFNADSAYSYIQKQVDFGPRIPGTPEHAACAVWMESKMKEFIPDAFTQNGVATTYDRKKFTIKNIIAPYNPDATKRILLCAHWDTRPFADRSEGSDKNKKFDGANDGGSGVGVLMEVARQLHLAKPDLGIDIIFFDLEDYGQSGGNGTGTEMTDSWCLGSQHWAKFPHKPGYYAKFGILLDMVGAKDAKFPREGSSVYYAPGIVDKVWATAKRLGYGNYFIDEKSGMTTDDHVYINTLINIPTIDILHYDVLRNDYFAHHHRVTDTMEQIDKETLSVVGQLVLQVIWDEATTM